MPSGGVKDNFKEILMVSSTSVEEWEPKSNEWIVEEKQRMPTAMHGFDTIPVKIKDFCRSSIFSSLLLSLP